MPWTEESPLATAFGAASGFLNGMQQGQQQKAEAARQAALDKDHALAVSVAQQHQKFEEGRETSGDAAAADDTRYNRTRDAAADARSVVTANDQHKAAMIANATAAFQNSPQMQQLQIQKAILDNKYAAGQITAQQYAIQSAMADAQVAHVRAQVAQRFGVSDAELSEQSTRAAIDSTNAGTDATRQSTRFAAQEEPTRQAQGRANLFGTNVDNAGRALALGSQAPSNLSVNPSDPHAKIVESDTANHIKAYNSQLAAWQKNHEDAVQLDDGSWKDGDDVFKKPPEDFETFSDALDTLMTNVSKNPKQLQQYLSSIDKQSDMTTAQKTYAKRRLIDAAKSQASPGGAPGGGRPFGQFEAVVTKAANEFGIPAAVLHAVGMQESGGGTTLTPDGHSPDPKNAGHGWFQLDPASGAPPDVLARAAKDPVYAARVAANQLKQLYAQWGSWPAAIAAYNAGNPQNPQGQAYAQQVIGRIR